MGDFLPSGRFSIGANYWASHAGLAMWHDWRPEVVEEDFIALSGGGLQMLRVFPLWPDFQPINLLRAEHGVPVEFRHGEMPLPDDEAVQSGVSTVMLDRLGSLLDLAAEHQLQLVVALITGWMSGRLFVPPGLDGLNAITDPLSQRWQIRLARALVGRFRDHPAIRAWDLGNECNMMGVATRDQAWMWTSALSTAIRNADPTHPIISGMHSLSVDPIEGWTIRDQGELNDILTTHPYPLFTPHCHREPLSTMRPILHGTAETCLYADLGSKPAFVEEFGNLGPMVCGESETAAFLRSALTSLWAHDARGALWWCAFDQTALHYAPYDWVALERELGLFREDRRPKPVVAEMQAFRQALARLPFPELPRRQIDAVCILTPGQDHWGAAYSAFLLAKQAGFDLRFHYADRVLPEAGLYLLPSLSGYTALSRRRENELWEKVRAGATAYVSLGDGMLGRFAEATGLEVVTRAQRQEGCVVSLPGAGSFPLTAPMRYQFTVRTAEVIAREDNGQPFFCKNKLGQGEVFLLCAPLEVGVAAVSRAFAEDAGPGLWRFYSAFAEKALAQRLLRKSNPSVGLTEHTFPDGSSVAVIINYSPQVAEDSLSLRKGFAVSEVIAGQGMVRLPPDQYQLQLPPNGFAVWRIVPCSY